MDEDVLVIGAGPAGIACAYYLEEAGITYKVIDRAHQVASTWSRLYPSLRLNTTRFFSHLPGKRFPLSFGMFPTGKQYHRYLEQYVEEHQFNIHLGISVYDLRIENDGWRVETSEGNWWYPCVISATGRFCSPVSPPIPGREDYERQIIHACDYVGPEPYEGKQVMVVGNGPSGVDIASELGDYAANPVLLSQRTGVVLRPRYPWGLPKHLWMLIAEFLPGFIAKPLMKKVNDLQYSKRELRGIKVPANEAESSAAGGTRGRALINAVRAGKVKSVDGPVRFHPQTVELQDGTHADVDVVIMATGYEPVLYQYFHDLVARNSEGWPRRVGEPHDVYWQGGREVEGYPGLYLVGIYYQGKGAMYNFNVEAAAAVEEIKTHLVQKTHRDTALST